jgi:hypothetical protein
MGIILFSLPRTENDLEGLGETRCETGLSGSHQVSFGSDDTYVYHDAFQLLSFVIPFKLEPITSMVSLALSFRTVVKQSPHSDPEPVDEGFGTTHCRFSMETEFGFNENNDWFYSIPSDAPINPDKYEMLFRNDAWYRRITYYDPPESTDSLCRIIGGYSLGITHLFSDEDFTEAKTLSVFNIEVHSNFDVSFFGIGTRNYDVGLHIAKEGMGKNEICSFGNQVGKCYSSILSITNAVIGKMENKHVSGVCAFHNTFTINDPVEGNFPFVSSFEIGRKLVRISNTISGHVNDLFNIRGSIVDSTISQIGIAISVGHSNTCIFDNTISEGFSVNATIKSSVTDYQVGITLVMSSIGQSARIGIENIISEGFSVDVPIKTSITDYQTYIHSFKSSIGQSATIDVQNIISEGFLINVPVKSSITDYSVSIIAVPSGFGIYDEVGISNIISEGFVKSSTIKTSVSDFTVNFASFIFGFGIQDEIGIENIISEGFSVDVPIKTSITDFQTLIIPIQSSIGADSIFSLTNLISEGFSVNVPIKTSVSDFIVSEVAITNSFGNDSILNLTNIISEGFLEIAQVKTSILSSEISYTSVLTSAECSTIQFKSISVISEGHTVHSTIKQSISDYIVDNISVLSSFSDNAVNFIENVISEGFIKSIPIKTSVSDFTLSNLGIDNSVGNSSLTTIENEISEGFYLAEPIKLAITDYSVSIVPTVMSFGVDAVNSLVNEISEGHLKAVTIKSSVSDYTVSVFSLSNSVGISNFTGISNVISEGNNEITSIRSSITEYLIGNFVSVSSFGVEDSHKFYNIISEGINRNIKIRNTLENGITAYTFAYMAIGSQSEISISNTISEGHTEVMDVQLVLSEGLGAHTGVYNEVSNLSDLQRIFNVRSTIGDVNFVASSVNRSIKLDGFDISSLINSEYEITINQANVHNSISFNSVSRELFILADPRVNQGKPRVEVIIGNETMWFLLEERSIDNNTGNVSYWGRDITARDNSPWTDSVSVYVEEEWVSAKETAENVLSFSELEWEIDDWMLPPDYEIIGTPVEILQDIAGTIGGIVRASRDGKLKIRKKYPVRPVYIDDNAAVCNCSQDIIWGVSSDFEFGSFENQVVVSCDFGKEDAPKLELEETEEDRTVGTTSYIRAYWYDDAEHLLMDYTVDMDVTDGDIEFVESGVQTETEVVIFSEGIGSISFPIQDIVNISWIGREGADIIFEKYSTELTLSSSSYCIAEITYTTNYDRYRVFDHNVTELMAIFNIENNMNFSINVYTNPIFKDVNGDLVDRSGSQISLTSTKDKNIMIQRGEAYIDDNKYGVKRLQFETLYDSMISDGEIVWIDADNHQSGKYQIIGCGIQVEGPKVNFNMEVVKWT